MKGIPLFSTEEIYQATRPISLWRRILLLFRPTRISQDIGSEDKDTTVIMKELFGKLYVIDIR